MQTMNLEMPLCYTNTIIRLDKFCRWYNFMFWRNLTFVLLLSHYLKLTTESDIDDSFSRIVEYSYELLRNETKIDKQLGNAHLAIQYIILRQ